MDSKDTFPKDGFYRKEITDNVLYKTGDSVNKKYKGQDKVFKNNVLPQLTRMFDIDRRLKEDVRKFEDRCRQKLFTENLYLKHICKDYLTVSKRVGYSEHLLEVLFRYMAVYQEIKGERAMKGADVSGRMFWSTPFFEEIRKDLMYMGLPETEVEVECLLSMLRSFQRLKYKDYKVLYGLIVKLVLESKDPKSSLLDQGLSNPFSAVELLRYHTEKYSKGDHVSGKQGEGTNARHPRHPTRGPGRRVHPEQVPRVGLFEAESGDGRQTERIPLIGAAQEGAHVQLQLQEPVD